MVRRQRYEGQAAARRQGTAAASARTEPGRRRSQASGFSRPRATFGTLLRRGCQAQLARDERQLQAFGGSVRAFSAQRRNAALPLIFGKDVSQRTSDED